MLFFQQIGLYIRREEKPLYTPILTPNASEVSVYKYVENADYKE